MRRVAAGEAFELVEAQGYVLVDVRSVVEFRQGHPSGAFNVPLMHRGRGAMAPNPDFVAVMVASFAKGAKLVITCQAGSRSRQAAALLEAAGFVELVDQKDGFGGTKDAFGSVVEPGWRGAGLPVSLEPAPGRSYEALLDAKLGEG